MPLRTLSNGARSGYLVNVYPVSDREIDQMLSTSWNDLKSPLLAASSRCA